MERKATIRLTLLVGGVAAITAITTLAVAGWSHNGPQAGSPESAGPTISRPASALGSPASTGNNDQPYPLSSSGSEPTVSDSRTDTTLPAAPVRPPGRLTSAQPPQTVPSAVTRTVTVYNKVTDGETEMREDSQPAYLSTEPRNYCKSIGCALPGTDVTSGAQLTVACQIQAERTTNGNDSSSEDDHNPGLYESSLWYGVRLNDGRTGYISEVWMQARDRGGLGLPGC
jgi:hypothetical protein